MRQFPLARPLRRALAACSLMILGACITWREQPNPLPAVRRTLDGPVRITRRDGSFVVFELADERGDSVIGVSKTERRRVSIPVDEVTRVQQRRDNALGTLALIALATAAAFGAYAYSIFNDPNY